MSFQFWISTSLSTISTNFYNPIYNTRHLGTHISTHQLNQQSIPHSHGPINTSVPKPSSQPLLPPSPQALPNPYSLQPSSQQVYPSTHTPKNNKPPPHPPKPTNIRLNRPNPPLLPTKPPLLPPPHIIPARRSSMPLPSSLSTRARDGVVSCYYSALDWR